MLCHQCRNGKQPFAATISRWAGFIGDRRVRPSDLTNDSIRAAGSMAPPLRSFLADLFQTAVAAAHPAACLPPLLPPLPVGRLIVLAAGKAAGSMAEVVEEHYLDRQRMAGERLSGVAVARHGYGRHLRRVRMIEA